MAFNDSRNYSDVLAFQHDQGLNRDLKRGSTPGGQGHLMTGGDPKAVRGVCWSPWCHNWVEDLPKDKRCHETPCDTRLWQEAIKSKKAVRFNGTILGRVDHLLVEPDFSEIPDYMPDSVKPQPSVTQDDMCCVCKDVIKRPFKETCGACHIKVRAEQHNQNRRKIAQAKGRTRDKAQLHHRGLSGLKGVKLSKK